MSYLPHLVVLAERASHARHSEEFRGTHWPHGAAPTRRGAARRGHGPAWTNVIVACSPTDLVAPQPRRGEHANSGHTRPARRLTIEATMDL
jgi:hypothetical protein